jgi:hypothetical protein
MVQLGVRVVPDVRARGTQAGACLERGVRHRRFAARVVLQQAVLPVSPVSRCAQLPPKSAADRPALSVLPCCSTAWTSPSIASIGGIRSIADALHKDGFADALCNLE